jgi:hypothetical protein
MLKIYKKTGLNASFVVKNSGYRTNSQYFIIFGAIGTDKFH